MSQPLTSEQLFDDIGPAYEQAFSNLGPQLASIRWLQENLSPASKILDIGCGTGKPVCSTLEAAGHHVWGVDISIKMIEDAKKNVPNGNFEKVDIKNLDEPKTKFDAITIYFSLLADFTQDEIRENIKRTYSWLRPGGLFVFATVPLDGNNIEISWMGRPIKTSSLSAEDAVQAVRTAGFEVVYQDVSNFLPKAVDAGLCSSDQVWEEPHIFIYARKH